MKKYCLDCAKTLADARSLRCKPCSKQGPRNPMHGLHGQNNPLYKGGYIHQTLGYVLVGNGRKKFYEHRLIAEEKLGRKLHTSEIVHHINGNKTDNRPENLVVMTQSEHVILHKPRLGTGKV